MSFGDLDGDTYDVDVRAQMPAKKGQTKDSAGGSAKTRKWIGIGLLGAAALLIGYVAYRYWKRQKAYRITPDSFSPIPEPGLCTAPPRRPPPPRGPEIVEELVPQREESQLPSSPVEPRSIPQQTQGPRNPSRPVPEANPELSFSIDDIDDVEVDDDDNEDIEGMELDIDI